MCVSDLSFSYRAHVLTHIHPFTRLGAHFLTFSYTHRHLLRKVEPAIRANTWTAADDQLLMRAYAELDDGHWADIGKLLGRTVEAVKVRRLT